MGRGELSDVRYLRRWCWHGDRESKARESENDGAKWELRYVGASRARNIS